MVGAVIAVIVGAVVVAGCGPIAGALNSFRAEKARQSSVLSKPWRDRLSEMYASDRNQELQKGLVRAFGGLIMIGGVVGLLQASGK